MPLRIDSQKYKTKAVIRIDEKYYVLNLWDYGTNRRFYDTPKEFCVCERWTECDYCWKDKYLSSDTRLLSISTITTRSPLGTATKPSALTVAVVFRQNKIRAWGIHRCNSWDDYNGYVQSLGDDAMESAYHNEEGMTLC